MLKLIEFLEVIPDAVANSIIHLRRSMYSIKRIMKLVTEAGLPTPIIKSDLFFEIVFMRDPRFNVSQSSDTSDTGLVKLKNDLSTRQLEILEILKANKLAPDEIINRLTKSVSSRTLRRDLQALKKKNLVDSEGTEGWARRWFIIR